MMEWWNEIGLALQIFYGVGILGTVILIVQLIMTLIGADAEGDMDTGFDGDMDMDMDGADAGGDHPSGLQLLSIRSVTAFMTGFGWAGAFALKQGLALPVAVMVALAVGVALTWLVFMMMKMLYGLRESGSLDYQNAIGAIGSVYIPIPPGREGEGQVQVMVQGRICTVPACTAEGSKIPSGRQVRVLSLVPPRTLVVESVVEGASAPKREEA